MVDWQWHPLASAKETHLPLADAVQLVIPQATDGRACGAPLRRWGRMLDRTVTGTDFLTTPFL